MLLRYVDDTFQTTFITTIGVDCRIKTIELNGKRIKLQIWDTAGQERLRSISTSYCRGAMGVFVVYDITLLGSFDHLTEWLRYIENHAPLDVEKVLIGNKCDCSEERSVSEEKGRMLAEQLNIPFLETSSKSCINIKEAFELIATLIYKKQSSSSKPSHSPDKPDKTDNIRLPEGESLVQKQNKCSC
eukprot:Em0023g239a